jgi:PAS domain S-box-containing protein
MTKKPTYEALEQRVRELEKEAVELKRSEAALLGEKNILDDIIKSLPGTFYIWNDQERLIRWNKKHEEITGYSAEDYTDMRPIDFFDEKEHALIEGALKKVFAEGEMDLEATLVTKNGERIPHYYTGLRTTVEGKTAFIGVGIDISERKQAEEALRKAHNELKERVALRTIELAKANKKLKQEIEERKKVEEAIQLSKKEWVSTFDAMSDWVSLIDLKYRVLRSNRVGEKFLDLPIEEMIGQICCELVHGTQEPIPECPMQKMLQTHQRETTDLYMQDRKRWLRISVDPIMDEGGNVVRAVHIVRDITEFKKIEEERLKIMKLESIGIIAGGIAHDFNNLLSIIMGNIELAKDDIKPEVGIYKFLIETEKASFQAKKLTKQLITFSKGGTPFKKIGSIGELVIDTTNLSILGSKIKCDFIIPHDLWLVDFDEGQMKHAINNMIVNAVESMPDGGLIDLRAENIEISPETLERSLPLPERKYVKISIRDQGDGIPEEHLSMIFDPYFSTKEMGIQKGMGLGLATTYSIINRHDGHIAVESEVRVGTTFTLYLPAHEKDIKELEPIPTPKPAKPAIHTGRILLMDDEEMIRNLSRQMLSRFGYDAVLAKDGGEAIELYKKAIDSGNPFEVVILDLTVKGGMGGKDAVKKILEIDSQAKTIVSSGYSNDPVMTNHRGYGFIGALPKPYTMKDLSDALDKIIKE